MQLGEMTPYIMGTEYVRDRIGTVPYRASQQDFDDWCRMLEYGLGSEKLLRGCEDHKKFFELEKDLAYLVPDEQKQEMFYSLKNGYASPVVPAACIHLFGKLYKEYSSPSLIFKQLPTNWVTTIFSGGYLATGFTVHDIVCTFFERKYLPVSPARPKNSLGTYSELYVQSTDMIALVPTAIADQLSYDDIAKITLDEQGLHVVDTYLKFMAGYNGACNSFYDLRRLV